MAQRGSSGIVLPFIQCHTPADFPLGMTDNLVPVWMGLKNLAPTSIDPRNVQPVMSHYTIINTCTVGYYKSNSLFPHHLNMTKLSYLPMLCS